MAGGITAIASLNNRLMPDLPGCPPPLITQATLDVMRDFCIQTECWQEQLTQTLTASTLAYTLAPTNTDADIMRIRWVKIRSLAADLVEDLEETDPAYYEFNGVATLTLFDDIEPQSTVLTGLVTKVVLAPKIDSTAWDTGLMNRYSHAIVNGVKARLMDNDKEAWGNPRRAQHFGKMWERDVALAKLDVIRAYRTVSIETRGKDWL